MGVLENLQKPSDIKELKTNELKSLSCDLRQKIIETVKNNGGHLASNLGVVDLTVALYKEFDFSKDKLIFDVGHQCYAHKILSDRKDIFDTLRKENGISGFPCINESEYDAFCVGHAGTSISAGLGYCTARDKLKEDYTVICVVGDGSLSNGLNLEALFASNVKPKNFIVILNDNGMSISKNNGGFYKLISKSTTKRGYLGGKKVLRKIFGSSFITKSLASFRDFIKRIFNNNNYFEQCGFKYVGAFDGNDIKELTSILQRVKLVARDKAVLLHVKTKKGKGFIDAENQPDIYHGVGEKLISDSGTFSTALGEKLNQLIEKDSSIVAITAGMKDGTGLNQVEKKYPNNFIDVGIAEEYATTLASGMAIAGLKPVVAIYSTFLQRAYDQILHDVCLQNLPVIFCLDRAGLVGQDGKTHQGVFDISYLSHMPNMKILAPNTAQELKDSIDYALYLNCPVAIRYPKNSKVEVESHSLKDGLWNCVKKGEKIKLLAVGPNMLSLAIDCANQFDGVGVISVRSIKPLDEKMLIEIQKSNLIVLEENSVIGGVNTLISQFYIKNGIDAKLAFFGVKDEFIEHGSIENQLKQTNLDKQNLLKEISKYILQTGGEDE